METCTNCGAELRPGARFCTTCGTRVNPKPEYDSGWEAASHATTEQAQSTSVLEPIQIPPAASEPAPAPAPSFGASSRTRDWGSHGDSASAASDPASNFRTALDPEIRPVDEAAWGTPPPSRETWSSGTETSTDTAWQAPDTWAQSTTLPDDTPPAAKPAADAEPTPTTTAAAVIEAPIAAEPAVPTPSISDAQAHALDLLRQLQTVIPHLVSGERDEGSAAMTLTAASLQVTDFAELQRVLGLVRSDPRDVQALSELAAQVDRIQALLDEHTLLADAVE